MTQGLARFDVLPDSARAIRALRAAPRDAAEMRARTGEIASVLGYMTAAPRSDGCEEASGTRQASEGSKDQVEPRPTPLPDAQQEQRRAVDPVVPDAQPELGAGCDDAAGQAGWGERVSRRSMRRGDSPCASPAIRPKAGAKSESGEASHRSAAMVDVAALGASALADTREARSVTIHNHGPAVVFYARPSDKGTNRLTRGTAATG